MSERPTPCTRDQSRPFESRTRWLRAIETGTRGFARAAVLLLLVLALPTGCDDDNCEGDECSCATGDYCYLACADDGCDLSCGQMPECGGICEDDCVFRCNDVDQCSALCEDNCDIQCERLSACGAICGDRCNYRCSGADRCGVEVGNDSVVDCTSVSSCEVECRGSCTVRCSGVGGPGCVVQCPAGAERIENGEETQCLVQ